MEPASPPQPRALGRYVLYDAIASGGMATVHVGRLMGDAGFERTVAIKRLHAQFAQDPEFVSMFLDEGRVVGRIRHPNVVPTLDVVAASGELFIVMEYVQGESLSRLLRSVVAQGQRIPSAYVVTMMAGVLHGLHAAHEAKNERGEALHVVHRDVSPQNILVGIDGVARVLDFGVAKAAGRIQTTRQGQLKGKLSYMAPEQISGEVSRATDIYAASVVLWEALTSQRLFSGNNEAHVMKRVLEGRVQPPSEVAADLPAGLDPIVLRGLHRESAERFATAKDMALALEEAVPPVASSRIGAWVEATAGKTLDERIERIAAIESQSSQQGLPVEAASTAAPPEAGEQRTADELPTQLSSSSSGTPGPVGPQLAARGQRRSRVVVGIAGTAVALSLLAFLLVGRGASPPAASSAIAATPAPPPASSPSTQAPPGPSSSIDAEVTVASAPTPATPPSASNAGRPSSPRWHPPPPRAPRAQAPGVGDGTSDRK